MITFRTAAGSPIPYDPDNLLGYLPGFFDEADPRPAQVQAHQNYAHGGGWFDAPKDLKLEATDDGMVLTYPGDPPQHLIAMSELRNETLLFFENDWLCILQPDASYRIARFD